MNKIIPFIGTNEFKLKSNYNEVRKYLKENKISHQIELWTNKGCTPEVPWNIIRVGKNISLFFAKDKMFKIYIEDEYDGELPNEIKIGMPMKQACEIDKSLEYDDWNEDWNSKEGYWIEEELTNNTVATISIFIPELENDEEFDKYEW